MNKVINEPPAASRLLAYSPLAGKRIGKYPAFFLEHEMSEPVMSMFANKEDCLIARAEYYKEKFNQLKEQFEAAPLDKMILPNGQVINVYLIAETSVKDIFFED